MPRKKNRRKEIQKAKRDGEPKQGRVGIIAHEPQGGIAAALAALGASLFTNAEHSRAKDILRSHFEEDLN